MKKAAFIFTGQGSQFPGMGKHLVEKSRIANQIYQKASYLLNLDLKSISFGSQSNLLENTEYAQIAIVVYEYALISEYLDKTENHFHPDFLAGHSLGELVALSLSGILNFKDLLLIVRERGRIMQDCSEKSNGGMLAVINSKNIAEQLSNSFDDIYIANVNSDSQIVYSGNKDNLLRFGKLVEQMHGVAVPLNVAGAFHSPYMDSALLKYKSIIDSFNFDIPYIPVYSNVTGNEYPHDINKIKNLMVEQLHSPVQWTSIINNLLQQGVDEFIEIGPKQTLLKFIPESFQGSNVFLGNEAF